MKSVIKKYVKNLLMIAFFTFIALYFSLKGEFSVVLDTVKNAKLIYVLVAFIIMCAYYGLEGYVLMIFGRLYNRFYTFKQGVVNSFVAAFFNGITPFQSGGQFAQIFVFNKQKIAPKFSASILLLNFIVYQSVVVLYSLVVVILKYSYYRSHFSNFFSLALLGFGINFFVICSLFVGAKSKSLQNFFVNVVLKIGAKVHLVRDYETEAHKVNQHLEDFRRELKTLQKNKRMLIQVSTLNIIKLTLLYCIPYFCAKSLNLDVSQIKLTEFIGVTSFVYMITSFIPIPGASGGSEGTFIIMFGYLLGSVGAKGSMIVWRFVTYYSILIVGAIVFGLDQDINRKGS